MLLPPKEYSKYNFSVKFTSKKEKLDYISKRICVPNLLYSAFIEEDCLKDMISLFQMKGMYNGGVILNYRSRLQEIAKECKISESTLRKRIKELLRKDMIRINGKHLELVSKKKIIANFGISNKKGNEFNKFKKDYVEKEKFGIIYCRKKLIENNQVAQRHKIINNIKNHIINEKCGKQKIEITIDAKIIKRGNDTRVIIKDIDSAIEAYQRAFDKDRFDNGIFYKFNPFENTTSRQKMANLFGCTHKSTGSRFIQKLIREQICVVEDLPNFKLFKTGVDIKSYRQFCNEYGLGYGHAVFRAYNTKVKNSLGNIYIRLSNMVKFIDINVFNLLNNCGITPSPKFL